MASSINPESLSPVNNSTTTNSEPVKMLWRSLPESLAFERKEDASKTASDVSSFLSIALSALCKDGVNLDSSMPAIQAIESFVLDLYDIANGYSDLPLTERNNDSLPRLGTVIGTDRTSKRFIR